VVDADSDFNSISKLLKGVPIDDYASMSVSSVDFRHVRATYDYWMSLRKEVIASYKIVTDANVACIFMLAGR
jgi:hypothetical protein